MLRTTLRNLRQQYYSLQLQEQFRNDFQHFAALAKDDGRFDISWSDRHPCLNDATTTTGYDRHYILHTGWAARLLARAKPALHVDIGSSLSFVSIASAIVPFEFYDYRPARLPLPGISTGTADLTKLPFADSEISSLSCMHVIEHVGLGRYGDKMDAIGDLRSARELSRVLAEGGQLLMVVPVGRPCLQFNAHRIYSYEQVLKMFPDLRLREFALIPDDTPEPELIVNAPQESVAQQKYACGCFWLEKNGRG
jgi:SAM-dependent methyltransferase